LDPWQLHYLLAGFDLTDAVERNDRRAESALQAPELTRAFCERLKQSKSPRRRPRSVEFDHFVHSVGKAYLEATGRPPRRGGRFAALLEMVVERLGLNPRRCDNAIKRVFRKQPKELRLKDRGRSSGTLATPTLRILGRTNSLTAPGTVAETADESESLRQ